MKVVPLDLGGRSCVVTTGPGVVHVHFSQAAESLAISPEVAQLLSFQLLTKATEVILAGGR